MSVDRSVRRILRRYEVQLGPIVHEHLSNHYPSYNAYKALRLGHINEPVMRVVRSILNVAGDKTPGIYPVMSSGYFLGRVSADVIRDLGRRVYLIPVKKEQGRFFVGSVPQKDHVPVILDDLVRTGHTLERVRRDVPLLAKAPAVVAAKGRPRDFGTRALSDLSYLLIYAEGGPHPRELLKKKKGGRKPFDVMW
ncbi:MAG: hypothetical protein GXN93_00530 [Candidatus Diapherotrites archaeon]|nr:hypothetical protein [Candidatus Diapherotrites archaeon]